MLPKLNDLLTYKNTEVLARYRHDFPDSSISANKAFKELMKFIWLSVKHHHDRKLRKEDKSLHFSCAMHPEMKEIDDMWHTFLLFTQDYHDFCHQYLNGVFFHHSPLSKIKKKISQNKYATELTRYLSYIYDNLGDKTLQTWFGYT